MEKRKIEIVNLYKQGVSVKEICAKCKCSTNTISKVLDEFNIPKRANRKSDKDLRRFFDLNAKETQYWIGYICADGNIQYDTRNRTYKVSLFSKEVEPINNFVKYFGENTVSVHKRKNGLLEAYISSKKLCEYFINTLNITPNKSLTLDPHIEFTSNFILGYFDGDGCIRNSSETQVRYESNITCGSKKFLERIKEVLDSKGIYSIIYKHTDCEAYKIRIDRKEESRKFYKFLYSNKVTCLSRKLNNFAALFGNLEDTSSSELLEPVGESAAKH